MLRAAAILLLLAGCQPPPTPPAAEFPARLHAPRHVRSRATPQSEAERDRLAEQLRQLQREIRRLQFLTEPPDGDIR